MSLLCKSGQGQILLKDNCWVRVAYEVSHNSFEGVLTMFSLGDSVEFSLPYKMVSESLASYPRIKGVAARERVSVYLRVVQIVEPDIVLDDSYKDFLKVQERYEQRLIKSYLSKNSGYKLTNDIYKKQLKQGSGKKLTKYGDVAMIAYEGKFLNGISFDEAGKSGQPFRYVRGQQWQVVKGLEKALAGMSEGEKALFVIPSAFAFGMKGLADIIPSNTPVVYEVEIIKMNNK
jgi:hypothetical protein